MPNIVKEDEEVVSVTCIMLTYNRLKLRSDGSIDAILVEEAVESFLRQNYEHKDLLIVNDTPGQTLEIPAEYSDQVRVINVPDRFSTLGDKYCFAIAEAQGDYVTPWDDDDIMLPQRLATCRQHLQGADVLVVKGLYCFKRSYASVEFDQWSGFAADWYRRELIDKHGYDRSSFGSDLRTRDNMCRQAGVVKTIVPNRDWHFYVYRWTVTDRLHLSGCGTEGYTTIGNQPVFKTHYVLNPHWTRDYVGMIENYRKGC